MLGPERRKRLLEIARESVAAAAKGMPYAPSTDDPVLLQPGAAFVTLRKGGDLRGCIGLVEAKHPLANTVASMARAAASEDYRFRPVHLTELPQLRVEISVLTPAERVADVSEIEVGRDGLIVEEGSRRGLLLPQVASEYGWTREEFLDQCCLKAGLPAGRWRKGASVYRFQAEVFGEGD